MKKMLLSKVEKKHKGKYFALVDNEGFKAVNDAIIKEKKDVRNLREKQTIAIANKYSNQLRQKSTESENIMIEILLHNSILFEFQKVFIKGCKFYIVDFYLKNEKGERYIIEIDGGIHMKKSQIRKDKTRTTWLAKNHKINKVLRFWNSQLLKESEYVQRIIKGCEFKTLQN